MAEYKQYLSQEQETGSVMISEDVVSTIAEHAISDVEGVVGIVSKPGADIARAQCFRQSKKAKLVLDKRTNVR